MSTAVRIRDLRSILDVNGRAAPPTARLPVALTTSGAVEGSHERARP
jgi:hypothetical protein